MISTVLTAAIGEMVSNQFLEHVNEFPVLKWPQQSQDLSPMELLWDVVDGRFTLWMYSQQISSSCVMLSCQYGPKSQRTVASNLLSLCHQN